MRVLVACECSGRVREAFRRRGHDAWSCDLKPAEDGSPYHIQGDVTPLLDEEWDLLIAHPVCTRLANSGAKHLYKGMKKENGVNPTMWQKLIDGAEFYKKFQKAKAKRKAIENPVMHGHAQKMVNPRRRQFVQPWWFGEKAFKATGFELYDLPDLVATNKLMPPKPGTEEHKAWSKVHREPPGPERAANRSRTFKGIAEAMAEQWGSLYQNVANKEKCSFTHESKSSNKVETYPATKQENSSVTINFTITADDTAELAKQIVSLAFMLAPNLRNHAAPVPPAAAIEPEIVEPVKRAPRNTKKAGVTIDHEPAKESESVVEPVEPATDGVPGAGGDTASGITSETGAGDEAADEPKAEVDAVAGTAEPEEPCMTIDALRAFTVNDYLNSVFEKQEDRKAAFGDMLKEFGVTKIGDLPADKINAWKAAVDQRIAAAVKA